MHGNWSWRSNVTVTVRRGGLIVARHRFHNLITTVGLSLVRDAILGTDSLEITEVAIGDNNTAPTVGDTALANERLRIAIIDKAIVDADTAITTAYVAPFEANTFTIEEIGWFGGPFNDEMLSRVLFNHTKTDLESIQIDRQDSFAEKP
ncbi:hypothetical protein LCGC14_3103160 [marine sediment metagenome]|uniref:Phage tail fibre protein N-terminal domain-containing protein n=1 Tax=marine sediment metagenome TaxID=412755 RepID=A0A0F8W737_9ZZZZ